MDGKNVKLDEFVHDMNTMLSPAELRLVTDNNTSAVVILGDKRRNAIFALISPPETSMPDCISHVSDGVKIHKSCFSTEEILMFYSGPKSFLPNHRIRIGTYVCGEDMPDIFAASMTLP